MQIETPIRILSAEDVRRALPMKEAVETMKNAFSVLSAGHAAMPVRSHLEVPEHGGTALFMPSFVEAFGNIGVKVVNVFENNPEAGLPRIQALVCLFDGRTGAPAAVVEGTSLTALRTGAASGAATDLLARADARTLAVLGAGVQGRTQIEAVCAVRPIQEAHVYDPVLEQAEAFVAEMGPRFGVEIKVAATAGAAVRDADIVCTATVASRPVFSDSDIREGTHINAVGSYQPGVQEIPGETVKRARLVVDHRESTLAETGDLIIPIRQGLITENHIKAELGEIVLGHALARSSPEEVTLFKSVGLAVQDLAAASRILDHAQAMDLGTLVSL